MRRCPKSHCSNKASCILRPMSPSNRMEVADLHRKVKGRAPPRCSLHPHSLHLYSLSCPSQEDASSAAAAGLSGGNGRDGGSISRVVPTAEKVG